MIQAKWFIPTMEIEAKKDLVLTLIEKLTRELINGGLEIQFIINSFRLSIKDLPILVRTQNHLTQLELDKWELLSEEQRKKCELIAIGQFYRMQNGLTTTKLRLVEDEFEKIAHIIWDEKELEKLYLAKKQTDFAKKPRSKPKAKAKEIYKSMKGCSIAEFHYELDKVGLNVTESQVAKWFTEFNKT